MALKDDISGHLTDFATEATDALTNATEQYTEHIFETVKDEVIGALGSYTKELKEILEDNLVRDMGDRQLEQLSEEILEMLSDLLTGKANG